MELDEHRNAIQLDQYWDAITRGETPSRGDSIDDVAAAVIANLAEARITPELNAARSRAINHFLATVRSESEGRTGPTTSPTTLHVSGSKGGAGRLRDIQQSPAHPWLLIAGAIAAVVALAIAFGYLFFELGRQDDSHRKSVPAVILPATPPPPTPTVAPNEVLQLVDVALPAEALPKGGAGAALSHDTIMPGVESKWTVAVNISLDYIWRGSLTVRSANQVQVQRNGKFSQWETFPSETDITLGPGDAILIIGLTSGTFSNLGTQPVEILNWGISSDPGEGPPSPAEWIVNDYALSGSPGSDGVALQGKPARLRLSQVILTSGSKLSVPAMETFQLVVAVPDNGYGTPTAPSLTNSSSGQITSYGKPSSLLVISEFEIEGGAGTPIVETRVE